MLDDEWVSSTSLKLQTDSAAGSGLGCGVYFDGHWCQLFWPEHWYETGLLKDITFLEFVPIALAVCLWKISFRVSGYAMAVVHISIIVSI